jgi:hypothetical protein
LFDLNQNVVQHFFKAVALQLIWVFVALALAGGPSGHNGAL